MDFFVKYINGREEYVSADVSKGDALTIELTKELDYNKVEYVELDLHEEEISAGDDGFYIVSAGWGRCENHDYGVCFFEKREDCEVVLRDIFMPVFGLKHNGVGHVAIVTGMATDVAHIIKIENN